MANLLYILTHIAEVIIPMFEWLGPWSYVLLFMIIFMETGLVIFPWLPGESLIFLTASFIAFHPVLKMEIVIPVFFLAAFIGDTVNYFIGRSLSRWQWLAKRVNGPGMVKAHWLGMESLLNLPLKPIIIRLHGSATNKRPTYRLTVASTQIRLPFINVA